MSDPSQAIVVLDPASQGGSPVEHQLVGDTDMDPIAENPVTQTSNTAIVVNVAAPTPNNDHTAEQKFTQLFTQLQTMSNLVVGLEGKVVRAEIIPGKCADPPAPAMITLILFFSAFLAYWYIRSGVLCADIILVSNFIPNFLSTFSQNIIVLKSD